LNFFPKYPEGRRSHPDKNYCEALLRYQHELTVKCQSHSVFIHNDYKHCIKIGDPGYLVAAIEPGRQAIVSPSQIFAVGDLIFFSPQCYSTNKHIQGYVVRGKCYLA